MSLPDLDPVAFAQDWVAAWNAHDVEAVLAHFHDDVLFTSPLARLVDPASDGTVRGKAALRRYWTTALGKNPDLAFALTGSFTGVDSLLIVFRNEKGEDRIEVLRFRDGLVVEGHGTYAAAQGAHPA